MDAKPKTKKLIEKQPISSIIDPTILVKLNNVIQTTSDSKIKKKKFIGASKKLNKLVQKQIIVKNNQLNTKIKV